jgi:type II secretory pathway pseudopilin PulG
MSLVELLVVVAILGMLAVTVLPNLSNTAESRRGREATRSVSGFIAKAQSRAIGRREWAGFLVVPSDATTGAGPDLVLADMPAVYRGDTVPATLQITGTTATTRTATSATAIASILTVGGTTDDLIRFDGRGPFFQIDHDPTPGPAITGTSVRFELRGNASGANEDGGYQAHNTPWPPMGVPLAFELFRQPTPAGSPLSLGGGFVVDVIWSGMQTSGTSFDRFVKVFAGTERPALRLAFMFDGTGRLRQVVERLPSVVTVPSTSFTVERNIVVGPVFLLVGRSDRAGQSEVANLTSDDDTLGANWQYPESHWLAIDPLTGMVKVAECVGGSADVIGSQALIRQALLATGR